MPPNIRASFLLLKARNKKGAYLPQIRSFAVWRSATTHPFSEVAGVPAFFSFTAMEALAIITTSTITRATLAMTNVDKVLKLLDGFWWGVDSGPIGRQVPWLARKGGLAAWSLHLKL